MKSDKVVDLRNLHKTGEPVDIRTFCKGLEYAGRSHKHGYFHYTTWSNFEKMVTPVKVSDREDGRMFFVTKAPNDKNDLTEGKLDKRFWYVSFTYSPFENAQMWISYGKYKEDAIRLRFSSKAIVSWIGNEVAVYEVPKRSGGEYVRLPIKVKNVRLLDIGYVAKEREHSDIPVGVLHRDHKYALSQQERLLRLKDTEFAELSPYFKNAAWKDEREVRLLLEFDNPLPYNKIALDFTDTIEKMLKHPKKNIVRSPWSYYGRIGTVAFSDCAKSECEGEIASKDGNG